MNDIKRCHLIAEPGFPRGASHAADITYDEGFVRAVADWQEDNLGSGQGDGKVGPMTEAHLNIQHPQVDPAAENARATYTKGR